MFLQTALVLGGAWYVIRDLIRDVFEDEEPPPFDEDKEPPADATDAQIDAIANKHLALAGGALAMSTFGKLVPPFGLLSIPFLIEPISGYFRRALEERRAGGTIAVLALDSIALGGALVTGHLFAVSLGTTLVVLSFRLQLRAQRSSRKQIQSLFAELPQTAWLVTDGGEVEVALEQIAIGDRISVVAGGVVPLDGRVVAGIARIDERVLTGESQPVEKTVGAVVLASTVVVDGRVVIEVERTSEESVAAQVVKILDETLDYRGTIRARSQQIVERGAIPTLGIAAVTLPLLGLEAALAVTYSSFGYHMRIAAPIAVDVYINLAIKKGILIKDGRSLEELARVDTIVFDKTGTLTQDIPQVGQVFGWGRWDEAAVLRYAAAAEQRQVHPIAHALLTAAAERGLVLPPVESLSVHLGAGLFVDIEGHRVLLGSHTLMTTEGIELPSTAATLAEEVHARGGTVVYLGIDGELAGAIELSPVPRPEAAQLVADLHERGYRVLILSGDQEEPTRRLASSLGIDEYHAQILPQDKAAMVEQLRARGHTVCVVGDGLNDTIALKTANVSVSLQGASTVAQDTASMVLMDGSLKLFLPLIDIAKELEDNIDTGVVLTIVPGLVSIAGVYLLGFGLVPAIVLYNLALVSSVGNAARPLIRSWAETLGQPVEPDEPPARPATAASTPASTLVICESAAE
jgi:heavy metal translocating P-type ATPase